MNRKERRYRITEYSAWPSSMAGIPFDARKYYLANFGPMAMGFTVYEDFDSYGGGVFKHVTGKSRGGHCVLVVGYSDTHQAWICRNSWGTGFGGAAHADGTGAGFFMIAYGDSNIDDTFYGCHGVIVPPQSRLAQRVGDVDGDGITEVIVTSPWGIGILKQAGATMAAPMMAPNGTRFGGWLLNTGDNHVRAGRRLRWRRPRRNSGHKPVGHRHTQRIRCDLDRADDGAERHAFRKLDARYGEQ